MLTERDAVLAPRRVVAGAPVLWFPSHTVLSELVRNFGDDGGAVAGPGEQGMVRAHERDAARRLARAGGRRPWWVAHPVVRRPSLGLECEAAGSRAVVRLRGDLDGRAASHLEAALAGPVLAGCRELELDLAGVPSMGSGGLSVLLGVRRWCLQRDIPLRLRGLSPSVQRLVEPSGLGEASGTRFDPSAGPAQELALF